jgi:hypothetical protein
MICTLHFGHFLGESQICILRSGHFNSWERVESFVYYVRATLTLGKESFVHYSPVSLSPGKEPNALYVHFKEDFTVVGL